MRQGTTPNIKITCTGVTVSDFILIYIILKQGHVTIEKTGNDVTVGEDNSLSIRLTQEETLSLSPSSNQKLEIQVRALTETDAVASDIIVTDVEKVLKAGVIEVV